MKPASFVDRPSDRDPPAVWLDAPPACLRSEAFAEDLLEAPGSLPPGESGGSRSLRAPARRRRSWALWGATLALIGRRPVAAP